MTEDTTQAAADPTQAAAADPTQAPAADPTDAAPADAQPGFFQKLVQDAGQAGEAGKRQWEDLFARAQTRGADLLLRAVRYVRTGAETLEKRLEDGRPAGAPGEPHPEAA